MVSATTPVVPTTVSDRKRLANRHNARKSTGPSTREGKAQSSKNAITHGLFARDLIIEGEDPQAFKEYRLGMLRRLDPHDELELHYAEQVIHAGWKIKRIHAAECEVFRCQREDDLRSFQNNLNDYRRGQSPCPRPPTPGSMLARLIWNDGDFPQLQMHEQRLQNMMSKSLAQLRKLQKEQLNGIVCDFASRIIDAEEGRGDHTADDIQENEATDGSSDVSDGGTGGWSTHGAQTATDKEEVDECEATSDALDEAPPDDSGV